MANLEWCESRCTITLPSDVTLEVLSDKLNLKKVLAYPVKVVDFSAVQQVDSAVLALLLVWSKKSPPPIQVLKPPAELLGLMRLYDLEEVVQIKEL